MRLIGDPLAERGQNARLADARFARDERDLTFALDLPLRFSSTGI
jgi:hypothetical protein